MSRYSDNWSLLVELFSYSKKVYFYVMSRSTKFINLTTHTDVERLILMDLISLTLDELESCTVFSYHSIFLNLLLAVLFWSTCLWYVGKETQIMLCPLPNLFVYEISKSEVWAKEQTSCKRRKGVTA